MAPDPDELDALIEYDLEDEDSMWVATTRRAISRELRSAFTDDLVERLIDRFEKELHFAVVRQPHLWGDDDSALKLDAAALYPVEQALQVPCQGQPKALYYVVHAV